MSNRVFPAPTGLSISLLGRFGVYLDGVSVSDTPWRRVHLRRLVEVVGSHRVRREARDVVLQALWPGFDDARARNRLHHTVHLLRKAAESCGAASSVIQVDSQSVALCADVVTDVDVMQRLLATQASPSDRLRALLSARDLYKGDLAPDWTDCEVIEARRVKLRRTYLEALSDAADLALELGQIDTVLDILRRLTAADATDIDAHVRYADALFRSGRPDLALAHCAQAQQFIGDDLGVAAAEPLREVARRIQRDANTRAVADDVRPATIDNGLRCRPALNAAPQRLFGRGTLLDHVRAALEDPHVSLISLCGPPGVGKSTIGWAAASSSQDKFRDGAIRVDCTEVRDCRTLLETLCSALVPLTNATDGDADRVLRLLSRCQMLIWLDELEPSRDCAAMLGRLANRFRDCRFLVGSVRRLHVTGERCIRVGTLAFDELSGPAGELAPAVQMLESCCRIEVPDMQLNDRSRAALRRIAKLTDGLPAVLEVAAAWLQAQTPSELIARLERLIDGSSPSDVTMQAERRLNVVLDRWLLSASNSLHTMLAQAATFQGWFTREDLRAVVGAPIAESDVDALVEDALDASLLFRRIGQRGGRVISEFRLPYLVRARVRRGSDSRMIADATARHSAHVLGLVDRFCAKSHVDASQGIDELVHLYLADIEAVVARLADDRAERDLVRLVLAVRPALVHRGYLDKAHRWLTLGLELCGSDHGARIELMHARAGVLDKMNRTELAFREAQSAYRLACEHADAKRQPSVERLMAMLSRRSGRSLEEDEAKANAVPLVAAKGIEAGENLLRVAMLAARYGSLREAMDGADSAERVFRQFSCVPGQLRALRYAGRLAFALGDLDRACGVCDRALALATRHDQSEERFRVELLFAEAQLAHLDVQEEVRKVERLLGQAQQVETSHLVARATRVLAWHYFRTDNLLLARILGAEFKQQSMAIEAPALRADAHLLMSALHARAGARDLALKELAALTPIVRDARLPTDPQTDLATLARMSLDLRQDEIASTAANALDAFSQRPGHRLRPCIESQLKYVRERLSTRTEKSSPSPHFHGMTNAFEALLLQVS